MTRGVVICHRVREEEFSAVTLSEANAYSNGQKLSKFYDIRKFFTVTTKAHQLSLWYIYIMLFRFSNGNLNLICTIPQC